MYDSIKDIWQGRIFPDIKYCVNGEEIMEVHKRNTAVEENIMSALPDEKKQLFERLLEDYLTLIALLNEDAFTKGFKLGARIIKDALE